MNLKDKLIEYSNINNKIYNINSDEINSELDKLYPEIYYGNNSTEIRRARKAKAVLVYTDRDKQPVCGCGSLLEYHKSREQSPFGSFREFCSISCMTKDKSINLKRKKTNISRFGVDSYSKIQIFNKKTDLVKKEAKEKAKETYRNKYGVDHYSKTNEYLEKRNNTTRERYGVDCALELVNKDNIKPFFKTDKGKEYLKNQLFTEERNRKSYITRLINNNKITKEFAYILIDKDFNKIQEYIEKIANNIEEPDRFKLSKEIGISTTYLNFLMRKVGIGDKYNSLLYKGTSSGEREVNDFIKSLGFNTILSDRTILGNKKELDIYIPQANLAIEFNGIIWHTEGKMGRDRAYHIDKTNRCEKKDIQLLQIYDIEWYDEVKRNIWKSIIKCKLGCIENKIYARNCIIERIDSKKAKEFLNNNHLNGFIGASEHYALLYNNKIVSVMSFGKSRFKDEYEIIRYATILDTIVIGGMTRLINMYKGSERLISYADRRYSSILKTYYTNIDSNFSFTPPSWKGLKIKEYDLKHRLSFTKSKMMNILKEKYDNSLTVFENMLNNGYDRIWDSGNIKYIIKMG